MITRQGSTGSRHDTSTPPPHPPPPKTPKNSRKKKTTKTSKAPTRLELWSLAMTKTMKQTARELKMSLTTLKRACRKHGTLSPWPFRRVNAFRGLLRSPFPSIADKRKIEMLIASAPSHNFNFSADVHKQLRVLRAKVYKKEFCLKRAQRSLRDL